VAKDAIYRPSNSDLTSASDDEAIGKLLLDCALLNRTAQAYNRAAMQE